MTDDLFKRLESATCGSRCELPAALAAIRWNTAGLIPAIAQDVVSGRVLMLAWMNRASLRETLDTGSVCYWSRSRQQLWRKGEQSGHVQKLVAVHLDCDADALLLLVSQRGTACHTGRPSCFYNTLSRQGLVVTDEPRWPWMADGTGE